MPYEPLTYAQAVANFLDKYGIPEHQHVQAMMEIGTIAVLFSMAQNQPSPR